MCRVSCGGAIGNGGALAKASLLIGGAVRADIGGGISLIVFLIVIDQAPNAFAIHLLCGGGHY